MGVAALDANILYREFGINAEYLIDHAHGIEPCTIAQIHAYRPQATSLMNGQVLSRDYSFEEARTVMREMVDTSVLDLVERKVVCDQVSLYVGYGRGEAPNQNIPSTCIDLKTHSALDDTVMIGKGRGRMQGGPLFRGEHGTRPATGYGAFEHGGGQRKLSERTSSFKSLMPCFEQLFDQTIDPRRAIRRVNIGFGNLLPEEFETDAQLSALLDSCMGLETAEESSAHDLRILVKQHVTWSELMEVVRAMLPIPPTKELTACLHRLYAFTPRWGTYRAALVQ